MSNSLAHPGRVAVFGGTFDPPHLAHTLAVLWALETGEVDAVLVVPVAQHAFGKEPTASFAHRVAMCQLAIARLGRQAAVEDLEGHREGTSYMVDTLVELKAAMPDSQFRLLAGTDVIKDLPKWRDSERVIELAPPLELPRPLPGDTLDTRPGLLPPISSTQVREALATGRNAELLVGRAVLDYIHRHQLYLDPET